MGEDAAWRLEPRGHQKSRPINRMETQDVFTYHVQVGRPKGRKILTFEFRVPDRGDVVDERIEPNINHVFGVARHRDSPAEASAGDRQIAQAAQDKADDLVAPAARRDRIGVRLVIGQEAVLPRREAEKIVLLFNPFDFGASRRFAIDELAFVVKSFVTDRIPSSKVPEIDLTAAFEFPPQRLDTANVARLGSADEIVVADVQQPRHLTESRGIAIGELT